MLIAARRPHDENGLVPMFVSVEGRLAALRLLHEVNAKLPRFTIPNTVKVISTNAFDGCSLLTGVVFGNQVLTIGNYAFNGCSGLTRLVLPASLTNVATAAFEDCSGITTAYAPAGLASIGDFAFSGCSALTGFFFAGNPPASGQQLFLGNGKGTVYYFAGSSNWPATFGGLPTALWNPTVPAHSPTFGVRTNEFGFTISGPTNLTVVVEVATNLLGPVWVPVGTNVLSGGSSYFNDPGWASRPRGFYRFSTP